MKKDRAERILILSRYLLCAVAAILWLVMMILPSDIMLHPVFQVAFLGYLLCATIYSFVRKKYPPLQEFSRAVKIVAIVMILLLVVKLAFF